MPGGRGTLITIANALNNATESKESMKNSIDHGYIIKGDFEMLGAALAICDHKKDLNEIYCYADDKGQIVQEY